MRLQRKRTKGWKTPANAVYVGRPSVWANPYAVEDHGQAVAVALFREYAVRRLHWDPQWLEPLRGKDLLCWCPAEAACHADVLLELLEEKGKEA